MAAPRCPYCHGPLDDEPVLRCPACRTPTHVGCVLEHGGCPTLGCAPPTAEPARAGAALGWEAFVADAAPWLEVGASMRDAWDLPAVGALGDGPIDEDGATRSGSASASRAA